MDEKRFMELRELKMEKREKHILLHYKLCLTAILVMLGFLSCIFFTRGIIIGAVSITTYVVGVFAVIWTECVKDENGKIRLFGNCGALSGEEYNRCIDDNEYITVGIIVKSMLVLGVVMLAGFGLMILTGVA